ncbi:MAG TPA: HAD family hydrolase [Syntrophomonadaceae bacterium]|nr:HAD family hydrolase [Syntrophomonadaceae bacterium]
MFDAILFDLDGTLLDIDMDFFLKHYFERMAGMAGDYGVRDGKRLVEQVWKSTAAMIGNRDPGVFNEEAFMNDFFSDWEFPEEHTRGFFNDFYIKGFPLLRELCQPLPSVPGLIETVFRKSGKVVIATNAVFPREAIQQRLNWAGIGNFPYELVTSYELMHFCKPHPEYYQEISEMIGVPPERCLMVGNDKGEDLPAGRVGMKTFLVEDGLIDSDVDLIPDWQGSLAELETFIGRL